VPQIRVEADGKRVLLVHGSPRKMNEYLAEDRALSTFQRLALTSEADVIVFGHTHVPYTKDVDGVLFVNVGSVGKPKDGDPRSCYAMLELTADRPVTFRRVEYDVQAAPRPCGTVTCTTSSRGTSSLEAPGQVPRPSRRRDLITLHGWLGRDAAQGLCTLGPWARVMTTGRDCAARTMISPTSITLCLGEI
jgi:diadenosine tetraphosphatase ApaH/serine/threonine PP2A family protein phosphatase